jgi:hypothetical protein
MKLLFFLVLINVYIHFGILTQRKVSDPPDPDLQLCFNR